MRARNSFEKALGLDVPIEFIKDYRKPMKAGGRVIKKGVFCYVTLEAATPLIEGGYAKLCVTDYMDEEE